MKRHSKIITVEYVVQDCPICGKIIVKHYLYPMVDKERTNLYMAKKVITQSKYHCRDCVHSYDRHEKNLKGEFFMCRCPFFTSSRFLNRDVCDKFNKK